jgi:tRNA threonylcarbamoyladenosine biosynthesis protein TsaB
MDHGTSIHILEQFPVVGKLVHLVRPLDRADMLTLAIDCSSTFCSVAVTHDMIFLAAENARMDRGHAAALPPMMAKALKAAGQTARDLDAIAVSTGPGSFTGLRIGMAAAKGLALALDRPLIGISCFDSVARSATRLIGDRGAAFDILIVALASKRAEIFIQGRDYQGVEIIPGQLLTPIGFDEAFGASIGDDARLHIAGEAARNLGDALQQLNSRCRATIEYGPEEPPDAADIGILAQEMLPCRPLKPISYETGLSPIYMRPPTTKAP